MASNVLSRILPQNGSPSVYETIRQHDADSDNSDVEERAGLMPENYQDDEYTNRELEEAMADAGRDEMSSPTPSEPFLTHRSPQRAAGGGDQSTAGSRRRRLSRPRWMQASSPHHDPDDGDDDVPASLYVEGRQDDDDYKQRLPPPPPSHHRRNPEPPVPGPSSGGDRARWEATREHLPLHTNHQTRLPGRLWSWGHPSLATVDPKEKALWLWANVENLDNFLKEVYTYFLGNGIWSILLDRFLSLLYAYPSSSCLGHHGKQG